MITKRQITKLRDAIDTFTDQIDDFKDLLNELERYKERVEDLKNEVEWLEGILEDYGIDPRENRQWRISAICDFIQSLGV